MKLAADLHIHSHYSRATSKNLTPEGVARWAQIKGIQVVATGDISHPGWLQELKDRLEPAEEGLFRLKAEHATAVEAQVPPACRGPVRFLLGGEISNIYKRGDRTRKVHNLVFAPNFAAVERLQAALDAIGNIRADGRPILGLDSRDLLEITLEAGEGCCLIPAHIWTPWFSLLGSKSGFDSVEECFGDLTPHIFALETGLSSDPAMNWRVSALDRYTLVSNSDAHSAEKLGRELTLFDCELSYAAIFAALRRGETAAFDGTVEFFPEEGKYHFDGHRACGIVWDPATTLAHGCLCPVCGKEVTVGVMHRVEALADRPVGGRPERAPAFTSLIPLPEVLGEVYGVGAGSRQVEAEYTKLLGRLGPELHILREAGLEEISRVGGPRLAEAIGRMRRGDVVAQPGYDGEYGVIRVFSGAGSQVAPEQIGLFDEGGAEATGGRAAERPGLRPAAATPDAAMQAQPPGALQQSLFDAAGTGQSDAFPAGAGAPDAGRLARSLPAPGQPGQDKDVSGQADGNLLAGLNDEQRAAALCVDRPLVIVAGPGTGKTRTLTVRIAHLILDHGVAPESILAITFTNKAAGEMAERLAGLVGPDVSRRITIKTFHAFGALLLREHGDRLGLDPHFVLCAAEERTGLLRSARPDLDQAQAEGLLERIAAAKDRLLGPDAAGLEAEEQACQGFRAAYRAYEAALAASSALDFDDLVFKPVELLETRRDVLDAVRARYRWISVDEYQDVNLAQYRLLRLLADGGVNLCVIGDPNQAIYGFRGADRRYFLSFGADYPTAAAMRLSRNYRSTQLILDAAVQVIRRGGRGERYEQYGEDEPAVLQAVQTLSDFASQVKLDVYDAPTDRAEAEYVVHQIEQMVGGTSYFSLDSGRVSGDKPDRALSFGDFAVLYRLGAQSRLLIEAFARSGIPYQAAGQEPLYGHRAVREALAYLWVLRQPASRLHLQTALTAGKAGLGDRAAALVCDRACTAVDAGRGTLAARLEQAEGAGGLTAGQRKRLGALAAFFGALESGGTARPVTGVLEQVIEFLTGGETPDEAEGELLHRLALRAVPFGADLAGFLESTALLGETDTYDPRAGRVALLTLHAAKGLEFPVVFVVGCEEGLLPYVRPGEAQSGAPDIDEERRLFYVGMTRARQRLVLTRARTRMLFGRRMENPASRFVGDIEAALKEMREMERRGPRKPEDKQLSLF